MKGFQICCCILISIFSLGQSTIHEARKNITIAVEDQKICNDMISRLQSPKNSTEKAYLGAYYTISAKHQFLPTSKLNHFNKGKKLLEKAVSEDPNTLENRYLRLLIQTQSPKFLGFHNAIETDQKYLCQNFKSMQNTDLKNKTYALIKGYCPL